MDYHIQIKREKRNTAGAKAPSDASSIFTGMGMKDFPMPLFPKNKNAFFQKVWLLTVAGFYWMKLFISVHPGDRVFYQHPMYANRLAAKMIPQIRKRRKCIFIVLIHDLESLRGGIEGVLKDNKETNLVADNHLLKQFDYIICHNEHMKKYLLEKGFDADRITCLEIFDYLNKCKRIQPKKGKVPSIAIAGNLAKGKSGYIYQMLGCEGELKIHLYGVNFDKDISSHNMIYHGSFQPDDLPEHLEGDFGLVWDGAAAETCTGNTGEYLRYNNPHKTSLYLASKMPVIVWRKAAIADFVLENQVGIVIDSLFEIEAKINDITEEEYGDLCRNVTLISEKLKSGYYLKKAVKTTGN